MSFWGLAISVSLAVFGFTTAVTLLLTRGALRLLGGSLQQTNPHAKANVLFIFRVLPLALALFLGGALALPSFLKFEPRIVAESVSVKLWLLTGLGAAVFATILTRAARMLRATYKAETFWTACGKKLPAGSLASRIPIFCVDRIPLQLMVMGFFRPKIFVSSPVLEMLTTGEIRAALAHEMAHVSFFDNLKRMLFRICRPPRWLEFKTETPTWVGACELAADNAALAHGASALDLAGALVKMARLKCEVAPDDVAVSHLLSDIRYSPLQARIVRLEEAIENPDSLTVTLPGLRREILYVMGSIAAALLIFSVTHLTSVLSVVHDGLELLVR
jgi:hypothetical protein